MLFSQNLRLLSYWTWSVTYLTNIWTKSNAHSKLSKIYIFSVPSPCVFPKNLDLSDFAEILNIHIWNWPCWIRQKCQIWAKERFLDKNCINSNFGLYAHSNFHPLICLQKSKVNFDVSVPFSGGWLLFLIIYQLTASPMKGFSWVKAAALILTKMLSNTKLTLTL